MDERRVPVVARAVTYGVVGLLLLAVAFQGEWWPVSSMRLFSRERTSTAVGWEVDLVDGSGQEHPLDPGSLGPSFAGLDYYANALDRLGSGRVDEICRALADAELRAGGPRAESVRIYQVRRATPTHAGEPFRLVGRDLRHTCAGASP